eukprot:jgi/Mesvir1/1275/Mv16251-RA.1
MAWSCTWTSAWTGHKASYQRLQARETRKVRTGLTKSRLFRPKCVASLSRPENAANVNTGSRASGYDIADALSGKAIPQTPRALGEDHGTNTAVEFLVDNAITRRGLLASSAACAIVAPTTEQQALAEDEAPAEDEALAEYEAEPLPASYMLEVPLRVVALRNSLPSSWALDFRRTQGKGTQFKLGVRPQLSNIYEELEKAARQSAANPSGKIPTDWAAFSDAVTLGDAWLGAAISHRLIQPVPGALESRWWRQLSPRWHSLLRRDEAGLPDPNGDVYGVPYRFGCTVIAYRKDKVDKMGGPLTDWSDLWRPSLAQKVAMVDHPREVLGCTIKSLGGSYNARDLDKDVQGGMKAIAERFGQLSSQVRYFNNTHYMKALTAGEVWVAVGWSTDVMAVAGQNPSLEVAAPRSGTSLWADVWAVPRIPQPQGRGMVKGQRMNPAPSPLLQQWFDFSLQPARHESFLRLGASPAVASLERVNDDDVGGSVAVSKNGLPSAAILGRSEFLLPMSSRAMGQYRQLINERTH